MKKYELIPKKELFQIKALRDFSDVKAGDLGGLIETESNLSHDDNCWIDTNTIVSGNARVFDNARISGNALVYGMSIFGNALVYGNARVSGNARVYNGAHVYGNALVYDNARISGNTRVCGNTRVSDTSIFGNASVSGDAKISKPSDYLVIQVIGSENGVLTAYKTKEGISCTRGCFTGTLQEFDNAVHINHAGTKIGREYNLAIELIKLRLGEDHD